MSSPLWTCSALSARAHAPGLRLARAQRFAALLAVSLFALGTLLPGDAVARDAKARAQKSLRESGWASYYGREFYHHRTASGERMDPNQLTAAHRSLPFGTRVRVTNLDNGKRVVVRINDRGPFKKGRVLDVTPAAARQLGFANAGLAHVRLDVLTKLPKDYTALMDAPAPPRAAKSRPAARGSVRG
jgi:rare lipoprotein A